MKKKFKKHKLCFNILILVLTPILLMTTSCTQILPTDAKDLKYFNLKGSVRSVTEEYKNVYKDQTTSTYFFDKNGILIGTISSSLINKKSNLTSTKYKYSWNYRRLYYYFNGKKSYTKYYKYGDEVKMKSGYQITKIANSYDENDNIIRKTFRPSKQFETVEFKYDNNNNLIEKSKLKNDTIKVIVQYIYINNAIAEQKIYNSEGNAVKTHLKYRYKNGIITEKQRHHTFGIKELGIKVDTSLYNGFGDVIQYTGNNNNFNAEYDSKGNWIEERDWLTKGNFKIEYDSNKNWIRKIKIGDRHYSHTRKIEYY